MRERSGLEEERSNAGSNRQGARMAAKGKGWKGSAKADAEIRIGDEG